MRRVLRPRPRTGAHEHAPTNTHPPTSTPSRQKLRYLDLVAIAPFAGDALSRAKTMSQSRHSFLNEVAAPPRWHDAVAFATPQIASPPPPNHSVRSRIRPVALALALADPPGRARARARASARSRSCSCSRVRPARSRSRIRPVVLVLALAGPPGALALGIRTVAHSLRTRYVDGSQCAVMRVGPVHDDVVTHRHLVANDGMRQVARHVQATAVMHVGVQAYAFSAASRPNRAHGRARASAQSRSRLGIRICSPATWWLCASALSLPQPLRAHRAGAGAPAGGAP